MRKVSNSYPSFDISNPISIGNTLSCSQSNDDQMERAVNEMVDYIYMLEARIHELEFKISVFDKARDALVIIEEMNKDVD